MLLELVLALTIGIFAGIITGLTPGIHVNLVSAFLLASLSFFSAISPITLVIFIVAMSITHTFLDFIPSIFLGAPDEDTSLAVLPGHKLLLKGKGYEALILTLYGGVLGVILILILVPAFIFILPKIYFYLKFVMFFLLLFTSLYLLIREKSLASLIIFLLAGFLGTATLNISLKESLLPLLTGLFGSSSLLTSIIKKEKLPKQKLIKLRDIKIKKSSVIKTIFTGLLVTPLCSFLPSLGSNQAAMIGTDLIEITKKEFLILIGAINTAIAGLSFIALFSISEARTGTAVAVEKLLTSFSGANLLIIIATIILSSILAFFLTILFAKFFSKNIPRVNYKYMSIAILIFLAIIVLIFSGFLGFLVFIVSTFLGLSAIFLKVRRTNLMASLMIPSILLYFPF